MPSKAVKELLGSPLSAYLAQCRVRNPLVEQETATHVPPTGQETRELLAYLEGLKINAVIVGSVGVLHYVNDPKGFRPTVDLDLFVSMSYEKFKKVPPAPGWKVDQESIGVISWTSPSGGYVDFMTPGYTFPSGEKTPKSVEKNGSADWPVASPISLFRLKLDTMRAKDLSDCMSLAKSIGHMPTQKELETGGYRLTQTQKENLVLLTQWLATDAKRHKHV